MENHVKTILALNFKPDSPVVGLNEMKPNISLTLGLVAGTKVFVFSVAT
jgi:hypothetical protein